MIKILEIPLTLFKSKPGMQAVVFLTAQVVCQEKQVKRENKSTSGHSLALKQAQQAVG